MLGTSGPSRRTSIISQRVTLFLGVFVSTACVRQELVLLALDAYPEAYKEFCRVMLVFIYGPDSIESPVNDLWSIHRRDQAAAQLARTIKELKGELPVENQLLFPRSLPHFSAVRCFACQIVRLEKPCCSRCTPDLLW